MEAGLSQPGSEASRLGMSRCCDEEHGVILYEGCSGSVLQELQELCSKAKCICRCRSWLYSMPDSLQIYGEQRLQRISKPRAIG